MNRTFQHVPHPVCLTTLFCASFFLVFAGLLPLAACAATWFAELKLQSLRLLQFCYAGKCCVLASILLHVYCLNILL